MTKTDEPELKGTVMEVEPEPVSVSSPLGKAIAAAFTYHAFGLSTIKFADGWAIGPTFSVRCEEDLEAQALLLGTVYNDDPYWYTKFNSIVNGAPTEEYIVLKPDPKGHAMTREQVKDKHGAMVEQGPTKCTGRALYTEERLAPLELAFPHYRLAKKLGVVEFRWDINQGAGVIYGYDDAGELQACIAPRIPSVHCEIEEQS